MNPYDDCEVQHIRLQEDAKDIISILHNLEDTPVHGRFLAVLSPSETCY